MIEKTLQGAKPLLCKLTSGANASFGVIFIIILIIYDFLNPDRERDSYQWWYHIIYLLFWFILIPINSINLIINILQSAKNPFKGGTKCATQKGGGPVEIVKKFLGSVLTIVNITILTTGYLLVSYKPEDVSNILFGYLASIIMVLFIVNRLDDILIKQIKHMSEEWNWLKNYLLFLPNLVKKMENLNYILCIQGYIIILMMVFKVFSNNKGSMSVKLLKYLYFIIALVFFIGIEGFLMFKHKLCDEIG